MAPCKIYSETLSYLKDSPKFIGLPPWEPILLIPLFPKAVQQKAFYLYSPASIRGKMFKTIGQFMATTGFFSVLGRLKSFSINDLSISETVRAIIRSDSLKALVEDWERYLQISPLLVALSLGRDSPFRKVTALLFDLKGKPVALAKVGATKEAHSLIKNETNALSFMAQNQMEEYSPRLLGFGQTGALVWMLQEPLLEGRPSSIKLGYAQLKFLGAMANKTFCSAKDREEQLQFFRSFCRLLKQNVSPSNSDFATNRTLFDSMVGNAYAAIEQQKWEDWNFAAAHGDFAPWNLRVSGKRLVVLDWEYFLPCMPVGWDLLHYIFQVERLVKRRSIMDIRQRFARGSYKNVISCFEKETGFSINDQSILSDFVLLSVQFDLIPRYLCCNHSI
ncbi:MAG: hypothetical protein OH363_04750 [Candidatus Parvarchaeota archaeon]|nr:hypothetical protein [Candidatus Jingweiarchaeum tengchongense]